MSSSPAANVEKAETRKGATCPTCGKWFRKNFDLQRHIASRHSEKRYACDACTKAFGQQSALERHKRDVHVQKTFACANCGVSFAKKCLLDTHRRLHGETTTFACGEEDCGKTFSSLAILKAHMKWHTGAIKCAECDVSFKNAFELRRHMDGKHAAKKYGCEHCAKQYSYAYKLKAHRRTCAAAFPCHFDACDFHASDYKRLADHLVEEHQARHDLKCPLCDKWYTTTHGLRLHEQSVHKGAQKYACTCGYSSDKEHRFANHQERCSGEPQEFVQVPLDEVRDIAIERHPILDDFILDTHADDSGNNLVRKARKRDALVNRWSFAVKELKIRRCTSRTARSDKSQYLTEAQLMLKLKHKNLMGAHYIYEEPESLFIVMDLVRPGNLLVLAKSVNLSVAEVAYVIHCCAEALKHLHALGIVHRDMKSDNVLVSETGAVLVTDFGQSANAGLDRYSTVGTYGYTAPEIDDDMHTYALDIWPLPVIATECLAQERVPEFRGNDDVYHGEVYGWVESHQKSLGVSSTFMQFVDACLTLEPAQRISAKDLLQHAFIASANEESFVSKITHSLSL